MSALAGAGRFAGAQLRLPACLLPLLCPAAEGSKDTQPHPGQRVQAAGKRRQERLDPGAPLALRAVLCLRAAAWLRGVRSPCVPCIASRASTTHPLHRRLCCAGGGPPGEQLLVLRPLARDHSPAERRDCQGSAGPRLRRRPGLPCGRPPYRTGGACVRGCTDSRCSGRGHACLLADGLVGGGSTGALPLLPRRTPRARFTSGT